jgi:hypothetical protein
MIVSTLHVLVDSISPSESSDQNQESTTTSAEPENEELTPLFWWLNERGIFAAREFMHLPFDVATADFERKRAAGMHPGKIVKTWRVAPPTEAMLASIEPPSYTPAWFDWMEKKHPGLYRRGSDDEYEDDDDQADEEEAV